jgi:Protein of unknown function (DUF2934)
MTETAKKATTPRKPRVTAAKPDTPKTETPKKKAAKAKVTVMVSREEIAALAHRFWTERGRQHGHDAEDWLRAEQELLGKAS